MELARAWDSNGHRGGDRPTVILGAGPAGLTAAWELTRNGAGAAVFEADPSHVGGIARTEEYKGFRFDIGGHRFFTKADQVREIWDQILDPADWLEVPRLSRIYYDNRYFAYPLRASDALVKLGIFNALLCMASYGRSKALPRTPERSFEDWIVNRFGRRLFEIFFKTYTEKVWGMRCADISADWAAQRIKGLSLTEAIRNALPRSGGKSRDGQVIKTLIDTFRYPKHGPGMMWERAAEQVRERGGSVELGSRAVRVRREGNRVVGVTIHQSDASGLAVLQEVAADEFISTIPLRELVEIMDPPAPAHVRAAAAALRYRDYLTVVLVVDQEDVFPDNWIYVHDPSVALGRVQNYKNWSPHMVPDQHQTALGLEYFCTVGDDLWGRSDEQLIRLGTEEVHRIGLVDPSAVVDGTVVRMPKAYPVYDEHYKRNVAVVRDWLAEHATNLQTVGRNGMHKYNNQDHSMLAALLCARNILGEDWNPWAVNTDAEYHEEVRDDESADVAGRLMPRPVRVSA